VAARSGLRVQGMREARKRLDDMGDRARRPEPALRARETLLDLQMGERKRFSSSAGLRGISGEWRQRKRELGLDPRVMHASNRLEAALENANDGVRLTVFNAELRWGFRGTNDVARYASVQANLGRKVVVIDRDRRRAIAERVERFIALGVIE
jgi:hypothetical protein